MELVVQKRDLKANPHSLRKEGVLPAVVYGRSQESTPISINRKDFEKLFRVAGESTVITLSGLGENKDALIHEVVAHAVTGATMHVDFYAIEKGQKVTVSIPLEYEGVSPAVKDHGGVLVKVMHELEIEVQPKDLPQSIMVDLSTLANIDDKITVADLKVPASAIISADLEEVVAMVTSAEEETGESVPMDLSAIEVEKKGKKEEDAVPASDE